MKITVLELTIHRPLSCDMTEIVLPPRRISMRDATIGRGFRLVGITSLVGGTMPLDES